MALSWFSGWFGGGGRVSGAIKSIGNATDTPSASTGFFGSVADATKAIDQKIDPFIVFPKVAKSIGGFIGSTTASILTPLIPIIVIVIVVGVVANTAARKVV